MKAMDTLKKIDDVFLLILKIVTIALFVALTFILTINVFFRLMADLAKRLADIRSPLVRIVPVVSMHWMDEIVEMLFAALVFYGAAAGWILKGHFSAGDWIGKRMKSPRARAVYRLIVDLIAFAFVAIFFWYSLNLVMRALEVTSVFEIPKKVLYVCMPVSSGIMVLYSLKFIVLGAIGVIKPKEAEVKPAEA
jgi:TRAP-type C4-dicarboxylate transport system permease small subunit